MQDGSAWDPRASTPLASSSTPIYPSSTGASTGPSSHWLASQVLYKALQGLDIVVRNSQMDNCDQRIYLSSFAGLIVARKGKRATQATQGNLAPFANIDQAPVAENPEQVRKLYIVIWGWHIGKIGCSVGRQVNSINQYNYCLVPVQIQKEAGIKWRSKLKKDGVQKLGNAIQSASGEYLMYLVSHTQSVASQLSRWAANSDLEPQLIRELHHHR